MALDIYAAKDLNHAFEIASMAPEKRMEDHVVSEPEEIGDFLYDIPQFLTLTVTALMTCCADGDRMMKIELNEHEALILYRLLCRWESTGKLTVEGKEESKMLWDLQCVLEKELEPVDEAITKRLV